MSYIGNEPVISAIRTVTEATATANQTVFNPAGGYTVGYLDVFVNGVQLNSDDFTATNGSSVTLVSACAAGDAVRLVAWGTFSLATGGGQYFGTATTKAIAYNANSIGENVTVTAGNNGLSAGPITINNGFTVTVESGAVWVIV